MKVWVVGDTWKYEGYSILGIFDSEQKAQTFKSLELHDDIKGFKETEMHFIGIYEFNVG